MMPKVPLMYLDSPNPNIWVYQDRGDAIVWADTGETIMLAAQAAALCKVLLAELSGLPSLTAILFVSDALSKGWNTRQAEARVGLLNQSIQSAKQNATENEHSHVSDWLESLGSLSSDLRKGIQAQGAFLAEVWAQFPRSWLEVGNKDALTAIEWLSVTAIERDDEDQPLVDVSSYRCKKAEQALEFASLLSIDEQAIRSRQKTGVDSVEDLPAAAEEVELKDPINQLLTNLFHESAHTDQGLVASLAWDSASTIALPRKPSEPDQLQIGGVSDITNRGNPDRLLMTELAADPDLLIARIANGQALYLRRESPPKPRPQVRQILIESSIRCWGEARITQAAFALAAAASEERRGVALSISTLSGDAVYDEDLKTVDGIAALLERLHPSRHPGQAIEILVQRAEREKSPLVEPLLIVSAATSKDTEYQRALHLLPTPFLQAVVEPDRWVEIQEHTSLGVSVWKRLRLSVSKETFRTATPKSLPQFVKMSVSPLRFLSDTKVPFVQKFKVENRIGAWLITNQNRILYFEQPGIGGLELGSLPSLHVLAAHCQGHDSIELVVSRNGKTAEETAHFLVQVSLYQGVTKKQIELRGENPNKTKYFYDQGSLIRIGESIAFIDQSTGQVVAESGMKFRHLGGPFFGDRELLLATLDNDRVHWHNLGKCSSTIGIVMRHKLGFPFAVASDFSWTKNFDGSGTPEKPTGRKIISTDLPELIRIGHDNLEGLVRIRELHKEAGFTAVFKAPACATFIVHPNTGVIQYSRRDVNDSINHFEREGVSLPISHSVTSRFNYVGKHSDGLLLARNRTKIYLLRGNSQRFSLEAFPEKTLFDLMTPFGNDLPQNSELIRRKWRLNRADLGACTVWLDSRGLLHLRDSDGAELSLMMSQSAMAGWFSNGEVFGPRYFTGKNPSSPSQSVADWYQRFIQQCFM
jgi:hypothetical protein